jgi:uncharacterized protein
MRPGITVQHTTLPRRRLGVVRCDFAAIIGVIPRPQWPEGATLGDFLEVPLKRASDLWEHPARYLFSEATQSAVGAFFENGGTDSLLFGVCYDGPETVEGEGPVDAGLSPLLGRLRNDEDIAILAVPDGAFMPVRAAARCEVQSLAEPLWDALLAHCQEMGNRFLVLDSPRGLHGASLFAWFERFRNRMPETRCFGALYYPWVRRGELFVPPCGAMLGVYARMEREHEPFGVAWAPANTTVRGVTHVEVELDQAEIGRLAEVGVNPLVVQSGRGVVVWGARTLSIEPYWMHINSRRVVSMIREQLRRDNEWAVFEPNDDRIWKVLERDVAVRLEEFWRAGLLTGESRHGDYEVQCDDETNPLVEREAGRMNVRVRFRPIGTTEHITIDLRLGESTA